MACEFKVGDLVWARMKGFPAWPGKVTEPKPEVKRPADKKKKHFVFFLGSENYAWVADDGIWSYVENKSKFMLTQRIPRGFTEAVEAMEELLKKTRTSSESSSKDDKEQGGSSAKSNLSKSDNKVKEAPADDTANETRKRRSQVEKSKTSKDEKPQENQRASLPRSEKKSVKSEQPAAPKRTAQRRVSSPPAAKRSKSDLSPESERTRPISDFDAAVSGTTSTQGGVAATVVKDMESKGTAFMPDVLPSSSNDSVLWPRHVVATSLKIGFLGLGTIGSAIVSNLLKSGHEVTVWNRTSGKCRDFVKDGALHGNSPCEVVQSCDITFSCVSDPTALKDLVFGNSGVLQGISQNKAYVDMSTVDVETMTDVCEAVMARGGRFLEAPVVGNKQLAIDGQLIVLAAGEKSIFDDCASCFQAIGKQTFYLGAMGLATRMKLVLNMLVGTTLAGLAESLALATKLGLNITDVLEVLSHSSASSQFMQEKGADMVANRYFDAGCKLALLQKDLKLAINMSDSVDQPLHVGSAVNELFKKAKAKGYGEHDISAVYRAANL
jgi:3-hydroxyisobutyrate dehydrogenase-like beta-hydroxyacid dehydrogenase